MLGKMYINLWIRVGYGSVVFVLSLIIGFWGFFDESWNLQNLSNNKVQVLNTISVLIAYVGDIIPYTNELVQFFQKSWEESSGESLLQIQLLTALKNFVVALGYKSPMCYSVLLPILVSGLDINSPDELLEDSMQLWEATISNAPSMVPQLLGYFPSLVDILERSFDHLKVAASIIEGYIILGGTEFLSLHASCAAKIFDLVVGNVNDRGLLSILPVIDVLIQVQITV
ncbi:importin-11 isoform X1 [Tanacetum coccineum]